MDFAALYFPLCEGDGLSFKIERYVDISPGFSTLRGGAHFPPRFGGGWGRFRPGEMIAHGILAGAFSGAMEICYPKTTFGSNFFLTIVEGSSGPIYLGRGHLCVPTVVAVLERSLHYWHRF